MKSRLSTLMTVSLTNSLQSKDVLIDVTFINEKDPPPPGFTVVENTHDTSELAFSHELKVEFSML